ncbi:hypothetical protein HacjB3_02570 [Halalkalicoccus jeotgali B3]|uniref:Inner membrane protein YgaP-like transmembrane domain-containing protein n=2 Tax=Halalkalicoccus jeotgali (strain DSM 18796 / CECT 7217 / JCM 14584 / KCTC 4019 / B3) TaxID=795797 RepID=D8J6N0_HALJB|nr:hypothetical protein HacjB3_02570 [Halalkalicoccus jeotgali B3]
MHISSPQPDMNYPKNVGGTDRIIRGVLGIWLVVVALAALLAGQRTKAAIAGLAGIGLLQNAWTQFCGCNALFGIDTTQ